MKAFADRAKNTITRAGAFCNIITILISRNALACALLILSSEMKNLKKLKKKTYRRCVELGIEQNDFQIQLRVALALIYRPIPFS